MYILFAYKISGKNDISCDLCKKHNFGYIASHEIFLFVFYTTHKSVLSHNFLCVTQHI
jgi:hypothetical protein